MHRVRRQRGKKLVHSFQRKTGISSRRRAVLDKPSRQHMKTSLSSDTIRDEGDIVRVSARTSHTCSAVRSATSAESSLSHSSIDAEMPPPAAHPSNTLRSFRWRASMQKSGKMYDYCVIRKCTKSFFPYILDHLRPKFEKLLRKGFSSILLLATSSGVVL